jgi:hypothetical protein
LPLVVRLIIPSTTGRVLETTSRTMKSIPFQICQLCGFVVLTQSFDYSLDPSSSELSLELVDEPTGISNVKTLFIDEQTNVTVQGISWIPNETVENRNRSHVMEWETYVDGIMVDNGTLSLVGVRRQLPTQISAGSFEVQNGGMHNITVRLVVDESNLVVTDFFNAYNMWVSILPLVVVLFLAVSTNMVGDSKAARRKRGLASNSLRNFSHYSSQLPCFAMYRLNYQ